MPRAAAAPRSKPEGNSKFSLNCSATIRTELGEKGRIDRAIEYLEAHLPETLNVQRLAVVAGLSIRLTRAFKSRYDAPPGRFRIGR
ncbi:MAG: hypothetical protein AAFP04_02575 [Myxococcota bacterium]